VPKWEYQGWDVEYDYEPEPTRLSVVAVNDTSVETARPMWEALNEAGQKGWELVGLTREPGEITAITLFLKRQIPE
jgi:hypothetical protein